MPFDIPGIPYVLKTTYEESDGQEYPDHRRRAGDGQLYRKKMIMNIFNEDTPGSAKKKTDGQNVLQKLLFLR
ncbi:MAG: hypothetical protein MZV70_04235 [Desulfobacterales bacterium]|nr:hypothetical protein [Desulfobacterales bacterium]